ncbi:Sec-independent protein translocase subunit TatA [Phycicoccus duodecadis]|uniref:Sec-independent protein translocase protein TatA n=1 Tax=Phycicoccus duodecadis TaxID=173053 RepID=A0A2N3YEQ8_9MICO|nr:Sec-independent protein translocase subunit TatA [Phycicoccus duodecadis]PKW25342.1 sec-independent protein translocase protein TatA [Phycicoccus duodecadis]
MGRLGPTEIIIIAVLVIVIFGWKRLPDAARSLGRSARVFKSEVDEMKKDNEANKSAASAETVRGESLASERAGDPVVRPRPVDDAVTPDPHGNAVHERTPRTDNPSGPLA